MYRSVSTFSSNGAIKEVGGKIIATLRANIADAVQFILDLINVAVVPLLCIGLLIYGLFLISSIATENKRNGGEDVPEKVRHLVIVSVVFVVLIAYGLTVGGWMSFVIGG